MASPWCRPQIAESEDLQRRFAREARAAIRLKHPNIAQLYDFAVEPDGVAYMIMEFIDGVTLQEMLAKNGPAPLDLTLEMARQGLEALRTRPANVNFWEGPYLDKEVPLDPWKRAYVYRFPGEHGDTPDILSYGGDGQPGGEGVNADIVSWKN